MRGEPERSGVLVIRAWTEWDRSQLRVRIISGSDDPAVAETVQVVSSASAAAAFVDAWLSGLLRTSQPSNSIPRG
jgi:hypothetical protein